MLKLEEVNQVEQIIRKRVQGEVTKQISLQRSTIFDAVKVEIESIQSRALEVGESIGRSKLSEELEIGPQLNPVEKVQAVGLDELISGKVADILADELASHSMKSDDRRMIKMDVNTALMKLQQKGFQIVEVK